MTQGQLGDPERTKIYIDNESSYSGKFDIRFVHFNKAG